MPFTVQEIENIANAALDFHMERGKVHSNTLQDKPLLAAMRSAEKEFPGGKDNLTVRVKGEYSTTIEGFEADDEVSYGNPANIKQAVYPYKFWHSGIKITMQELVKDGITVVDSKDGERTTEKSGREMQALANLLEDKLEDMTEGTERGENLMFWRDGTQDSSLSPGVTSIIVDNPASATVVGGIDQSANTWWRNRANVGFSQGADASAQKLVQLLQNEFRQLRRYGGRPNLVLCGSDFIDWLEQELRAKGNYTLEGWNSKGKTDVGVADISFKGLAFKYDPTLDDLSKAKYCYVMDTRHLYPMMVTGERMKKHAPARPEDKYVFYRAMTSVGGLVCRQRNCHGVYSIT